jgi:hypothetical protein
MFLFLSFMFFLLQNQRTGGQNTAGGWHLWVGEVGGEKGKSMHLVQICMHMYINAKMIPAETVPEIREGGNEGDWWRG